MSFAVTVTSDSGGHDPSISKIVTSGVSYFYSFELSHQDVYNVIFNPEFDDSGTQFEPYLIRGTKANAFDGGNGYLTVESTHALNGYYDLAVEIPVFIRSATFQQITTPDTEPVIINVLYRRQDIAHKKQIIHKV
jgi:hypothetical protein